MGCQLRRTKTMLRSRMKKMLKKQKKAKVEDEEDPEEAKEGGSALSMFAAPSALPAASRRT